jgi:hypothetical protein
MAREDWRKQNRGETSAGESSSVTVRAPRRSCSAKAPHAPRTRKQRTKNAFVEARGRGGVGSHLLVPRVVREHGGERTHLDVERAELGTRRRTLAHDRLFVLSVQTRRGLGRRCLGRGGGGSGGGLEGFGMCGIGVGEALVALLAHAHHRRLLDRCLRRRQLEDERLVRRAQQCNRLEAVLLLLSLDGALQPRALVVRGLSISEQLA